MCEYTIDDREKTCGNCVHWGQNNGRKPLGMVHEYPRGGGVRSFPLYACCAGDMADIEPDIGGRHFIIGLGADCHCQNHGDAFSPSDDFLELLKDRAEYDRDPYAYNGVHPADFL